MDEKILERCLMFKKYTLALLDQSWTETVKIGDKQVRKAKLVILGTSTSLSAYGAFEMFRSTMAHKVEQLDNHESAANRVEFTELYPMQGYTNAYRVIAVDRVDCRTPFEFIIYETDEN